MSGGSHSQHPRVPPVAQSAPPTWNHLQVPTFYAGRQPQHAHMSSEHHLLTPRPPTWHTPSTEAATPLFSLQQMLGQDRAAAHVYSRPTAASVDLSLPPRSTHSPRNGSGSSQNGESSSPISLSVRDAKQINSLAERRQSFQELVNPKRPKRMDSILERLNTGSGSVIVTAAHSSHDESSNGSQPGVVASPLLREDDVVSPASNEDSLDSAKSRRKRKPSKTVRMSKEDNKQSDDEKSQSHEHLLNLTKTETLNVSVDLRKASDHSPQRSSVVAPLENSQMAAINSAIVANTSATSEHAVIVMRRASSESAISANATSPNANKGRRKTLSESETIENIAAMIASTEHEKSKVSVADQLKPASPDTGGAKLNLVNVLASPSSVTVPVVAAVFPTDQPPTAPQITIPPATTDSSSTSSPDKVTEEHPPDSIIIPATEHVLNCAELKTGKPTETASFVEVENQLEKMFAGLGEIETVDLTELPEASTSHLPLGMDRERVTSTSSELNDSTNKSLRKKNLRTRGSKPNSRRSSECNSSEGTPPKKLKITDDVSRTRLVVGNKVLAKNLKVKKGGNSFTVAQPKTRAKQTDALPKDIYSYDSGSNASSNRSRGPFIQIRGPRESPISVSIVNTPSNEEDTDKTQRSKSKKSFHDDSEYRHKVRSKGFHISTLSTKYDAHTTDTSWICVFCKRGPHTGGVIDVNGPSTSTGDGPLLAYSSGDLFGPYVITSECAEYQQSLEDMQEARMRSVLMSEGGGGVQAGVSGRFVNKKAKKRHLQSWPAGGVLEAVADGHASESMEGMLESGPNRYEIWAHEDCIVWGPGVYLVGPRIAGLEGAVWSCCGAVCEHCRRRGASVTCLVRSCAVMSHVGCAKQTGWSLDEDTYRSYCHRHKNV